MTGPKDIPPSVYELLAPFIVRGDNWQRDPVIAQRAIEAARAAYERDGNPLDVWWAYCEARESGQPVPDWVLTYLDRCAVALLNLASDSAHGKSVTVPSTAIAEAFEMKRPGQGGRGSVFSEFANRKWLFYGWTVAYYMRQGDQETYAIEDVARKNGVSEATVRRAWKKFKAFTKSPTS